MVFFFKQKTAYEMRISDWSSDVCSSDLRTRALDRRLDKRVIGIHPLGLVGVDLADQDQRVAHDDAGKADQAQDRVEAERLVEQQQRRHHAHQCEGRCAERSEERRVGKEWVSTFRSRWSPNS